MLDRKPPQEEKLNRRQEERPRPAWDRQEERTAEAIPGGRRIPGSGCSRRASRKSDVMSDWVRAEDKTTSKDAGIRVTREHLDKIKGEAMSHGQVPAYVFGFDRSDRGPRQDWMAFPLATASGMMSVVNAILNGDHAEAEEQARRLAPRAYKSQRDG